MHEWPAHNLWLSANNGTEEKSQSQRLAAAATAACTSTEATHGINVEETICGCGAVCELLMVAKHSKYLMSLVW